MEKFEVHLRKSAQKDLESLDKIIIRKIVAVLKALEIDPLPFGHRKIQGFDDLYRIRIGNYRIVYEFTKGKLIICVIKIAHRKDVYRNL